MFIFIVCDAEDETRDSCLLYKLSTTELHVQSCSVLKANICGLLHKWLFFFLFQQKLEN